MHALFVISVAIGLETSLAVCLKTLFLQEHGFTRVVHRFWKPMLDALTEYVVKGAYSHCCEELQVRSLVHSLNVLSANA